MKQNIEGFLRDIESELDELLEKLDHIRYKIREAQIFDLGEGEVGVFF